MSVLSLSGCSTVSYLMQAGQGQLALINHARPISEVLDDPNVDPDLATLLNEVDKVKKFGEKFGLKPTQNYSEYVNLNRDDVVTVVTACAPLEFKPKIFSFPVVGSFNYLGWFKKEDALKHADQLKKDGWDVDVRGASAYSTLGWFKDPILSSMLPKQRGKYSAHARSALVNVVFHESVHATVYIKNQSAFNENVANFLADVFSKNYFRSLGKEGEEEWKRYELQMASQRERSRELNRAFLELEKIYSSSASVEVKKTKKEEILKELQNKFPHFREINNATLIQFQTYHSDQDEFLQAFRKANEDVQVFLQALKGLRSEDFERPQQERVGSVLGKMIYQSN